MKKLSTFLSMLLFLACSSSIRAEYTGRVFIDTNNNGRFDKGEKAFPNVLVSDGLHVVKTGTDGTFTLPGHTKERFIFITTPSGYKATKHYIPISGSQQSYDFGLSAHNQAVSKDGTHTYIHIADTEIFNTTNNEEWTGNLQNYASNENVAFIVHTGDICYENGLKEHIKLINNDNTDCSVYYCIGNHDLVKGKYGEELFEQVYGPVYYSFEVGNVHYIVTPMLGGDYRPSYTKADVYHWLKNDLAQVSPGKAIVVFNHDLLTYGDKFIYGISDTEQIDLNKHNLKAWVYGHWHINYIRKQGDVYSVSSATVDKGGIDHSPSSFRVMHVDGKGDFTSELRYSYLDKAICIASPDEKGNNVMPNGKVPLMVNVYSSTSPVREVVYSCEADGKKVLKNLRMTPASDWSWQAHMPVSTKYTGKNITVKVTARFANGEIAESEKEFVYAESTSQPIFTGNWNQLLNNPEHIGVVPDSLTLPLQLSWVQNVGANIYMTSPLIHNGIIYIASIDDDLQGKAHVYALDGQTGEIRWKYPTRNSVKNTIVIEENKLFAQDAEGYVYALDTDNGKLLWEKKLPVNGLPAIIEGLVSDNGVVYAGTGKGLCALQAKDGACIWQNQDWGQGEGATSTMSLSEDVLISSAQWHALYANDAHTGKLKWRLSKDGLNNRGASAAIHGNLIYITSSKSLFIIEKESGNIVARKEFPFSVDVTSTPLLTDNAIIFGSVTEGLVAVDKETFEIKWKYQTEDAMVYTAPYTRKKSATIESSPVLIGNAVYVGASDGTIYAIQKDSGELLWKYTTGAPVFGTVATSGNTLVVADFGGNVYTFVSPKH